MSIITKVNDYAGTARGAIRQAQKNPGAVAQAVDTLRNHPEKITSGATKVTDNVGTLKKAAAFVKDHGTVSSIGAKVAGGLSKLPGLGGLKEPSRQAKLGVELVRAHPKVVDAALNFAGQHPKVVNGAAAQLAANGDAVASTLEFLRGRAGSLDAALAKVQDLTGGRR